MGDLNPIFVGALVTGFIGLALGLLRDLVTDLLKEKMSEEQAEPFARMLRNGLFAVALALFQANAAVARTGGNWGPALPHTRTDTAAVLNPV